MKNEYLKKVDSVVSNILAELFDIDDTIQNWFKRVEHNLELVDPVNTMTYGRFLYAVNEDKISLKMAKYELLHQLQMNLKDVKFESDLIEIIKEFDMIYRSRKELWSEIDRTKGHPNEYEFALWEAIRVVWCNTYKIILSNIEYNE